MKEKERKERETERQRKKRKKERKEKRSFAWCSGPALLQHVQIPEQLTSDFGHIHSANIGSYFVTGPVLGAGNIDMNKTWSLLLRIYV